MSTASMLREVRAMRADLDALPVHAIDRGEVERYRWYADSCPCGLPPGQCAEHPRARAAQRPPEAPHRVHVYTGGRGVGKSRAGVEWLLDRIRRRVCRNGLAIGSTSQDLRDVLVEGPSGFLACSPPWDMPRYEPSKRRLSWRSGARVTLLSGEEPDRCRGGNFDSLLCDELPHWARSRETFDLAMLSLRAGSDPKCMVTTTPKRNDVLIRILGEPTTVSTRETTFANKRHLAPQFIEEITSLYKGTRFAAQEIEGLLLDTVEGQWFPSFDPARHVSTNAEYMYGVPVRLAIDCGTSRFTAAVWLQHLAIEERAPEGEIYKREHINIFADLVTEGLYSAEAAAAIQEQSIKMCGNIVDSICLDPYGQGTTGIGPAAATEFERVLGKLHRWPCHRVVDGLDTIELLLGGPDREPEITIHPRCEGLITAFKQYRREERGGRVLDVPAQEHPHEDFMDSLRGAIRDIWPQGRRPKPAFKYVHPRLIY